MKKILLFFSIFLISLTIVIIIINPQKILYPKSHASGSMCNSSGVTINSNGSYSFSPLSVDSSGNIVNKNNPTCIIHLLGINMGGTFLGDASGTTDLAGLEQKMAFYAQNLYSNVVRVNYNSYWWDTDVYVPKARMHFKQWLQTFIKLQEQAGHYVILDTGPQFHNPPCGNDGMGVNITFCPSQNQAQKNIPPDPTESVYYEPPAIQGITDLATIYANDPAIIFDVWNEPANKQLVNEQTFMQDMTDRMNAVRKQAPNMLLMVYERALDDIMSGQFSDFNLPNIMFDGHRYAAILDPLTTSKAVFAHKHGQAFIIGEWGGTPGLPDPATMTAFFKNNGVESAYFESENLVVSTKTIPLVLNTIGTAVASGYQSIFGITQPPPTNTLIPTESPTMTPAPSSNGTKLSLEIGLHGIGFAGDNADPNGQGNMNPKHLTRSLKVGIFDLQNKEVPSSPFSTAINFDNASGLFKIIMDLGPLATGDYQLKFQSDGFLIRSTPQIIHITKGQTTVIPPIQLINGDINNDNKLNINDYSILVDCFGSKLSLPSCTYPPTQKTSGSDIDDNGIVDGADYNLFIRELSVQQGQ